MENLTKLGSEKTEYTFTAPSKDTLETFPSPSPYDYWVHHCTEEFTSLCPKTKQPDFAFVHIHYRPADLCVETKSLKLYLFAFRNEGAFMEAICNRIADDLIILLQPKELILEMEFGARGGIVTAVRRHFINPKYVERPKWDLDLKDHNK